MSDTILEIKDLHVLFPVHKKWLPAVDGVNLKIEKGESLHFRDVRSEPLSEATNVKALHALCQQTVTEENCGEPREICPGQRLQANHGTERRKRNADADSHNHNRHQQNRQRGAALEERNFFGSQHVYHQGLRKQSLNEPAGLEK